VRAHLAADDDALDARELALEILREAVEDRLADDDAENGVAEELEPLVRGEAVLGNAGVGEGAIEQRQVFEPVAEERLNGL
jgi:hypothetical protein